ncbi:MAG: single-stranded DNA-binding protein [Nanoarchaeota archaeon]|nr:single-stranded DNA-binding protein [Nanoarchaeota archaeon]
MNLNKVQLIGRLTADLELRTTASGQSVTNFGLATNRYWTDKDGKRAEETEFHNIVLWGKQAEVASQYLKKGSLAYIEGRLQTRTWKDKEGQNRKTTEIIADRVQFGPRAAGASGTFSPEASSTPSSSSPKKTSSPAEDMPFEEPIPQIDLDDDEVRAEDVPF